MLTLQKATVHQLKFLLNKNEYEKNEEIAPRFLLEFAIDKLSQDSTNAFWWTPRLIVVNKLNVGMCGFKSPPDIDGSVEIGYGIVPSQQRQGFATHAVELLLKEAFSSAEIQSVVAHTILSNYPSQRVLVKNEFLKEGSKTDSDDDEVLIWRKWK